MLLCVLLLQTGSEALPRLAQPFLVEAAGAPITALTGHAAPFALDWNADGKQDLVVGEFGMDGGRARVFLNLGEDAAPRFAESFVLQAGGQDATVPSS